MWKMCWDELCEAGWSLRGAAFTAAAALFGKRSHGGKVVSLGSWRWFPDNVKPKSN